jgi:hypothetical protein
VNGKNLFAGFLGVLLTLVCLGEPLAAGALAGTVSEERFQWRGQVDGIDEILIRGGEVRVRHLAAKPIQRQDHRFTSPLPEWDVDLELYKIEGRGDVELIEEPSSWNEYTAVVRIDDSDHIGDGYYEFELTWNERDSWGDWGDRDDRNPWDDEDDGDDADDDDPDTDVWSWDDDRDGGAFRWEGRVDIGAEIRVRGGEHEVSDAGGQGTQEYRSRFTADLPEAELPVSLRQLDGRGRIELIQSPNADNGYTAVVRIDDSDSGDDTYAFELSWPLP